MTKKNPIMEEFEAIVDGGLTAAAAILNAIEILDALSNSPEHFDGHPSHGIRTGAGYAQGRKLYSSTIAELASHARCLVQIAMDDAGGFMEKALETQSPDGASALEATK